MLLTNAYIVMIGGCGKRMNGLVNRIYPYDGGVTSAMTLQFIGIVLGMVAATLMAGQEVSEDDRADVLLASGVKAYQRGDLESAIRDWKASTQAYAEGRNDAGQIDALRNQSTVLRTFGRFPLALEKLNTAADLAETAGDRPRIAWVYSDIGALLTLTRETTLARSYLDRGLTIAREDNNLPATAAILNNFGNLSSALGLYEEAVQQYQRCDVVARQIGYSRTAARAMVNAATAAAMVGNAQASHEFGQQAFEMVAGLADTHEKATLLTTIGQNELRPDSGASLPHDRRRALAREALQEAIRVSRANNDKHALSYALGHLARLHESEGRIAEALALTGQAIFSAQQVQSDDALYEWHWQAGRLHRVQEQIGAAIAAYERAIDTLETIRQDVAIGYGNRSGHASFRQDVGPLFFGLADLLLANAQSTKDPSQAQHDLVKARQTIERFKTVELVDYFQEQCVDWLQSKAAHVDQVTADTAVIYMIPLADRTELLLSFHDGLTRYTVPVERDRLEHTVRRFRLELEDLSTMRHLSDAQQLYEWLILPIEDALRLRRIDTLVFVPDGPLRLIPMGALHDGKQFLVQRYATAVTPGLTLTDPQPLKPSRVRVLAVGLSVAAHEGFAPLAHVPEGLNGVMKVFDGGKLIDEKFLADRLAQEIEQNEYSIVHIASHGEFGSSAEDTFVLTYDTKLTLTGLEQLIRPVRFRDRPVELLTLSACKTAAGDDRAALGLAGIALKAGARSAVATLWSIQDRAAAVLLKEFYDQIRKHPGLSKAKALQRAQIKVLQDWQFDDPYFWSAFLVIGNWL